MAATVTETSTVDVTIVDSQNYESVFKIDNPAEGLTLTAVKTAFKSMIDAGLLYSKQGNAFTSVVRANTTQTIITRADLEN